jgi:tetratricopeptide (TPR) repeat protein
MKNLTIIMVLISLTAWGQKTVTQDKMTPESWEEQSKLNKNLLPKYGHQKKTIKEKKADEKFIKDMLDHYNGDKRIASDNFIQGGFYFLYHNKFDTAMFRFNQAYLLDSTNTDIYWGYGGFFYSLGDFEKAKEQYEEGLAINSTNSHLLTDLGLYYKKQYTDLHSTDLENALKQLETSIGYLMKSYEIDPNYSNTLINLSVCYLIKDDCNNAWKYHDECKAIEERAVSDNYTEDLKKHCTRE